MSENIPSVIIAKWNLCPYDSMATKELKLIEKYSDSDKNDAHALITGKYKYKYDVDEWLVTVKYKNGIKNGLFELQIIRCGLHIATEWSNYVNDELEGLSVWNIYYSEYHELMTAHGGARLKKMGMNKNNFKNEYNAVIKHSMNYKNDNLHGSYKKFKELFLEELREYDNGKQILSIEYLQNNNRIITQFYNNGEKQVIHGMRELIDQNNNVIVSAKYCYGTITKFFKLVDHIGRDHVISSKGDIYVYKACKINHELDVYVKLKIPDGVKRINAIPSSKYASIWVWDNTSFWITANRYQLIYKGRTSKAFVEEIIDKHGNHYDKCYSFVKRGYETEYVAGEYITVPEFDDNVENSCGAGINFHKFKEDCDVWF